MGRNTRLGTTITQVQVRESVGRCKFRSRGRLAQSVGRPTIENKSKLIVLLGNTEDAILGLGHPPKRQKVRGGELPEQALSTGSMYGRMKSSGFMAATS